jgi:defect-in-organelle-trafficking protein DotC
MPKFIPSIIVVLSALLIGCSYPKYVGDTNSLAGLQAMANVSPKQNKKRQKGKIRQIALKETALSLGAQAGLAWRSKAIDEQLIKQSRRLDAVYDFNSLILEHNILPPVLLEGRNTLNLADVQTIRISDRTYKLAKQARFVTTPPNWRQYLWLDYVKPDYPHATLLPKTSVEKKIWCAYTEKGWKNGVNQANTILEENIARIKEDFAGMILYRKLLAMNMVTAPFVSHTDLGITGNGSELHIDDRVLRITALPALNINSAEWRAAVTKDKNVLEQFRHMEKLANRSKILITDKSWQPNIAPVNDNNRIH